MKIALPHEYGYINQHFGRSKEFIIVELDEGQIANKRIVSAEQLQHNHEGLAGLLKGEQVDTVIVGGIGARALEPLKANGMQVVTGVSGKIDEVVIKFARGQLPTGSEACCSHHHGEHGHGCSH
ncbi:NifB/NifX family molybdenum-iron cluster-binding protein [Desulfallas thermosapovorans]|uniref:Putative Fe-Mo cluster-binding NifX family protein n=1 Tax=Desulfallas thermosapovorans DSM 6562 TaxID=1121431 RepID=A0A5S4ZSP3_9FIRM|nr:NifB/NifX family molybdenum-iron cluster-binding protein [Desulfallas thermosapovorans]TYO95966.1 putative Fe-Mo cluster-binding NifX family protein [Desulfallas thermosapovorans DSM 6562]